MKNIEIIEEWRDMEDAPKYEVSNLGNIRHKVRKQNLKQQDNGHGYQYITVRLNGKLKHFYVHIAVAKAFIENDDPEHKTDVSHLDETNYHNWASNLAWATTIENNNMPLRLKRVAMAKGKPCRCIETGKVYYSEREAARQLNIQQSSINNCINGKQKTAGGFHWERVYEDLEKYDKALAADLLLLELEQEEV